MVIWIWKGQDEVAIDDVRDSALAIVEARDGETYYNLVLSPRYNFVLPIRSQSICVEG
jgi:hypothetical protein